MSDSYVRTTHTVIACPVCAKNGNGRGALQSCSGPSSLYCTFCGWSGEYDTVQSYGFPCKIYQIVKMDLSIVTNMFNMAGKTSEWQKVIFPSGALTKYIQFSIGRTFNNAFPTECKLEDVLRYLVAQGWLFPATYEIEIDV